MGSDSVPFYIEEDYDRVFADSSSAEDTTISMESESKKTKEIDSEKQLINSFDLGPLDIPSSARIRYIEKDIEKGEKGFVLGKAARTNADAEFEIRDTNGKIIVSDTSPGNTSKRFSIKAAIFMIFGLIASSASLFVFYYFATSVL